jgi:Protein of unknown function (DUF2637)
MSEQQAAGAPRALRLFALVAVCVGVAALAAAAFIFSYAGIHAVALQAGVNNRLAKGYPLILDVLLVVILAAVLALRGAGWPSRLLAWFSLLALLAAAAGADALHAAGDRLPVRTAEITVAVLPWALVLIAFVLLLAMLRQVRVKRQAQAGEPARPPKWQPPAPPPLSRQALVPGFPAAGAPTAAAPAAVATAGAPAAEAPAAEAPAAKPNDTLRLVVPRQVTPAVAAHDDALDPELAPDDPSSDEVAPGDDDDAAGEDPAPVAVSDEATAEPDTAEADAAGADTEEPGTADADADAEEPDTGDDVQTADMEMPVFHRMWSSPVPPADD